MKSIFNLEDKERQKYLRSLAIGEILGPPTGYPHKDMPWLKYYDESVLDLDVANTCAYDYFLEATKDFPNVVLLEYYGREYTREDIKNEVEKNIQRFKIMDLKAGDTVSFVMLNTPENLFLWYALSKMGVTANMIKFDESPERIKFMTELTESKYLFAVSVPFILENVEKALINNKSVEKVITIEVTESLPLGSQLRMLYEQAKTTTTIRMAKEKIGNATNKETIKEAIKQLKDLKDAKKIINKITSNNTIYVPYKDWKKNMAPNCEVEKIDNIGEYTSAIVYTGGTTGSPKGVQLTNNNLNAVAHNFGCGEYGVHLGAVGLNILPPAIAYYFNATHGSICFGEKVSLIPNFTVDEYPYLIKKIKPTIFMSGPILLETMRKKDVLESTSFIENPISGGDKLYLEEEGAINDYIKSRGGEAVVHQGYGMSECSAAVTCNQTKSATFGSIGLPLINMNIGIFDYDTQEERMYGEVGEICITGPQIMKGYLNNPEATKSALRLHDDGKIWLHTDDLGYIVESGHVFHKGRAKRMLTRSGEKVWLTDIEDEISKNSQIDKCSCVKYRDPEEREVPVAHIVLKDKSADLESIVSVLIEEITNKVNVKSVPKYFVFRDELPYSAVNRKCDLKALEQEDIFDSNEYMVNDAIIIKGPVQKLTRNK